MKITRSELLCVIHASELEKEVGYMLNAEVYEERKAKGICLVSARDVMSMKCPPDYVKATLNTFSDEILQEIETIMLLGRDLLSGDPCSEFALRDLDSWTEVYRIQKFNRRWIIEYISSKSPLPEYVRAWKHKAGV